MTGEKLARNKGEESSIQALQDDIMTTLHTYDFDGSETISPQELAGILWLKKKVHVTNNHAVHVMRRVLCAVDKAAYDLPVVRNISAADFMAFAINERIQTPQALWDHLLSISSELDASQVPTPESLFESVYETVLKPYLSENGNAKSGSSEEGSEGCLWPFPKEIIFVSGPPAAGKFLYAQWMREERSLEPGNILDMRAQKVLCSPSAPHTAHTEASKHVFPPLPPAACASSPSSSISSGGCSMPRKDAQSFHLESSGADDVTIAQHFVRSLLQPDRRDGVLVLHYPKDALHAKFLEIFRNWILQKEKEGRLHLLCNVVFQFVLLHLDVEVSARRQVERHQQRSELGLMCRSTGTNGLNEVTMDIARERYRYYKENVFPAVRILKHSLYYHQIDVTESADVIKEKIRVCLRQCSALEMTQATSAAMADIPLAAHVSRHARQRLVYRLDRYARHQRKLLTAVVNLISTDFVHILKQQAITGRAIIRSVNSILHEEDAPPMLLDVMAERGYVVSMDLECDRYLHSVCKDTGVCRYETRKVYHFEFVIPHGNHRWMSLDSNKKPVIVP